MLRVPGRRNRKTANYSPEELFTTKKCRSRLLAAQNERDARCLRDSPLGEAPVLPDYQTLANYQLLQPSFSLAALCRTLKPSRPALRHHESSFISTTGLQNRAPSILEHPGHVSSLGYGRGCVWSTFAYAKAMGAPRSTRRTTTKKMWSSKATWTSRRMPRPLEELHSNDIHSDLPYVKVCWGSGSRWR